MRKRLALLLFIVVLFSTLITNAQYSLNAYTGGQPEFTTYQQLMSSRTENNQLSIGIQRYSGDNSINYRWRVTVRLLQDFISGPNTVGAQNAYLTYNSQSNNSSNNSNIPISSTPVQLSKTNEATLIDSNIALTNTVDRLFRFNLTIQGGNHLLGIPNTTLHSGYEVKFYKISNQGVTTLMRTFTLQPGNSARFQIEYSLNNNTSLILQNGANLYNLQFTTAADYANGKSVTVNSGLKITGGNFNQFQLAVKASGPFTSSTTSSTIPLNVLRAEIVPIDNYIGLEVNSPITLSTGDQVMATRTFWSFFYSTFTFNLRFYIPPNTPGLNVPAGTYTTYVYFVLTPN